MNGKKIAVICEANPLHNGHREILREAARESGDGAVIAVMSGHFVQRGTPAVFDKYLRARALLLSGADLVAELPYPWSAARASSFASAGVTVAKALGADSLLFGSECGDIGRIREISEAFRKTDDQEEEDYSVGENRGTMDRIGEKMKIGPVPGPNDRLGAAYLVRCDRVGLSCQTVRRTEGESFLSASLLRERIEESGLSSVREYLPDEVYDLFLSAQEEGRGPVTEKEWTDRLFLGLSTLWNAPEEIGEGGGGVRERILKAARESRSGTEFFEKARSKRYTDSRIRRAGLYLLCGTDRKETETVPIFTTILALNAKGREVLSDVRKTEGFAVLTKPSAITDLPPETVRQIESSRRADSVYMRLLPEPRPGNEMVRQTPVILSTKERL